MHQRIKHQESIPVSKSKRQDIHFLIDLLDQIQPHIWKCLNHFTIHPDDKEDLQQEILLKLFKAISQFDFSKLPSQYYLGEQIYLFLFLPIFFTSEIF